MLPPENTSFEGAADRKDEKQDGECQMRFVSGMSKK